MFSLILYIAGLFTACGAGLLAAHADWRGLKIPNIYPLVVLGAFPAAYLGHLLSADSVVFGALHQHLISLVIMFVVTYILFATIRFGAGDAKLLSAFALWFTPLQLIPFLFYTTMFGAVLALVAIAVKRFGFVRNPAEGSWIFRLKAGENAVPYGIAIAFGAVVAFISQGFVAAESLKCFIETGCS